MKDGIRQIWSGKNKIGMVSEGWDKTDKVREEQDRHGQARTGPDRNC